MSKVQSYIYIAVIVLVLLVVAVVWNARKVDQQPVVSSQPSGSTAPEVSIKYNSDGSIDTSDWLTFRHEVYPYEIRYPRGAEIELSEFYYLENNKPSSPDQRLHITLNSKIDISIEADRAERSTTIDKAFSLSEYVQTLKQETEKSDDVPTTVSDVIEINRNGWTGYQYTITPASDWVKTKGFVITNLYIIHEGRLYKIQYNENEKAGLTVINTLRFYR